MRWLWWYVVFVFCQTWCWGWLPHISNLVSSVQRILFQNFCGLFLCHIRFGEMELFPSNPSMKTILVQYFSDFYAEQKMYCAYRVLWVTWCSFWVFFISLSLKRTELGLNLLRCPLLHRYWNLLCFLLWPRVSLFNYLFVYRSWW